VHARPSGLRAPLQGDTPLARAAGRPRAPPGLPLGSLALLWCFAAQAATGCGDAAEPLRLCALASAASLGAAAAGARRAPAALAATAATALAALLLGWPGWGAAAAVAAAAAAPPLLLASLPRALSPGEAQLCAQALLVACRAAAAAPEGEAAAGLALALSPLAAAAAAAPLLRASRAAAAAVALLVLGCGHAWLAARLPLAPLAWLFDFCAPRARALGLWALLACAPLAPLHAAAAAGARRILLRKAFHLLALAALGPAAWADPALLRLGCAAGLAALVCCEAARAGRIGAPGRFVQRLIAPFADGRDGGALILSPATLLLGMAAPAWLAGRPRPPLPLPLSAWAGLLQLGVGDAAAAAVGGTRGRTPLLRGWHKTWEGTVAGAAAAAAAAAALSPPLAPRVAAAVGLAAALEAVTGQSDNAFVPLALYALLRCGEGE